MVVEWGPQASDLPASTSFFFSQEVKSDYLHLLITALSPTKTSHSVSPQADIFRYASDILAKYLPYNIVFSSDKHLKFHSLSSIIIILLFKSIVWLLHYNSICLTPIFQVFLCIDFTHILGWHCSRGDMNSCLLFPDRELMVAKFSDRPIIKVELGEWMHLLGLLTYRSRRDLRTASSLSLPQKGRWLTETRTLALTAWLEDSSTGGRVSSRKLCLRLSQAAWWVSVSWAVLLLVQPWD